MLRIPPTGATADQLRGSRITTIAPYFARYGLAIVLAWFGAMKFTSYESQGISHWVANSPFLGWLYDVISIDAFGRMNGSIELTVAALIAVKPWFPKLSVVGGVLASLFFMLTLSFMVTTPGVGEASAGGFPVLSADGEFLMKDIANLGLALWLLADSVEATRKRANDAKAP
ncbi:YkgB family protein [Mycolicibacterium sp.]|uniref:YkgB family protein n=1 Tax=Mycolicibacterium sp. TaxID=2320850 RepID=UPI0037C782FD